MRLILLVVLVISILGILYTVNNSYLKPKINVQTLKIPDTFSSEFQGDSIRVAVLGDIHVGQSDSDYDDLNEVLQSVVDSQPDLVLLLGDYTARPGSILNMDTHRSEIANRLSLLTSLPIAAVLGNYEAWSNPGNWRRSLSSIGITVLHNDSAIMMVNEKNLCIRGLGDTYTNQFEFIEFPEECDKLSKITITHDPAGAFEAGVKGLIFAAHTHCGQVRLPLLGALWMPTAAPREATCGLYQDSVRLLWVTSGLGASILPIRLGAQAEWDLLTLTADNDETF